MRDDWYRVIEKRAQGDLDAMMVPRDIQPKAMDSRGIALYHIAYQHEGFVESANIIFKLVSHAQKQYPNVPRHLYLNIEGHRNRNGGFDADMLELQKEYVVAFLSKYLTEFHVPLLSAKHPLGQCNDVPDRLIIQEQEA